MPVNATEARSIDPYQAIADPNRRKMLDLLLEKERSVKEIVPHFDMSFGGVSQHLQVLHAAGLVARRTEGRMRIYQIRPVALHDIYAWLAKYDKFWRSRLKRLDDYLDER
jgi:DNA-binding transcriptional ArsR family regulator